MNVGLFDKAKEAVSNVQDSLPGGVVDDAKQAASGTASEASRCVLLRVSPWHAQRLWPLKVTPVCRVS